MIIDVIRAFTTSAFAFAQGAETITLEGTVEEAIGFREKDPDRIVMGEVNGLPPEGFGFGSSPSEFAGLDLKKKHIIQRTSSGTQGVVNSLNAETILSASFCNAQATVNNTRAERKKSNCLETRGFLHHPGSELSSFFAD